ERACQYAIQLQTDNNKYRAEHIPYDRRSYGHKRKHAELMQALKNTGIYWTHYGNETDKKEHGDWYCAVKLKALTYISGKENACQQHGRSGKKKVFIALQDQGIRPSTQLQRVVM